jgi:hypothetical protein
LRLGFPQRNQKKNREEFQLFTIGRSRNKSRAYQDFSVEARSATRSFTHKNQQQAMEGCLGKLEQLVNTLTAENQ